MLSKTAAMAALVAAAISPPTRAATPSQMSAQARVSKTTVTHDELRTRVRLRGRPAYVGSDRFVLGGTADAEIHVFVDAGPSKQVRRLFWIQFERYLPSRPDLSFDYSANRRMVVDGSVTWVRAVPRDTSLPARAGSDRDRVLSLLGRAGYSLPAAMMDVRMVQVLDDPSGTGKGREELMIIYAEDLASTGATLSDLGDGSGGNEAWTRLSDPLVHRAMASVEIAR